MGRVAVLSIVAVILGAGVSRLAAQTADPGAGWVVRADEGHDLFLCSSPGLSVRIHVDSIAGGSSRMAAGTAELVGENFGTHPDVDEIVHFLSDHGRFAIGADTFAVRFGTTMYVPRGVRHGFISDEKEPLRFYWVISPGDLAERFRERGRRDLTECPSR